MPLTIDPKPTQVARVFVGRAEPLTPATLQDVSNAIKENNPQAAAKYGRFLLSIVQRLFPEAASRAERERANRVLDPVYASFATGSCPAAASETASRR